MDVDGSLWEGLWCSPWILAGGLRPPDLPPGGLPPPGPPEVWLSYAPLMGITCRPLGKMLFFYIFFIRALELAANHEKQVFMFFAFLPPYMGVSGSLVPRKR